jgi:hypothetical protein
MAVVSGAERDASDDRELDTGTGAIPKWMVVVGALVVLVGVVLRFVTKSDLWLDESLTVNIAKLPLGDLHAALKQDGAPPLYYVLLHGWIDAFGTGDVAVRALAGVISVLTLPVVWFCGRRIGRPGAPGPISADPPAARLTAGIAVLLFAASPFAIRYATESRMYSLVILEVLLGYLAIRRVFERPSLGRMAGAALVVAAMLYTQYWNIYLLFVVGVAVLWLTFKGRTPEQRHAARATLVAMIAGVILFLPWLPTFLYQRKHTGTPWGDGQVPFAAFRVAIDQFAGGTSLVHAFASFLGLLLFVLLLLGAFGKASSSTGIALDVRTQPTVRWEFLTVIVGFGFALTAAWIGNSAFDGRYGSIVFPLFLLVCAVGVLCFAARWLMILVLAVFIGLGFVSSAYNITDNRTQAAQVASVLNSEAKPGDVVVYCPDQLGPAVNRLLDAKGLTQITYPSFDSPAFIDWVNYRDRIAKADPAAFAQRVVDETGTDHGIWFVYNAGYSGFEQRCGQLYAALVAKYPGAVDKVIASDSYFEADNLTRFGSG